MRRVWLTIILSCALATMAQAQEFRLLSFTDYYGEIEPSTEYETLRNRYYIQPEFSTPLAGNSIKLLISLNLWYQPLPETEKSIDRFVAPEDILREAYVELPLEYFDIFIGQKLVNFGFADAFSPLNVVNAADTTVLSLDDPYNSRRPDLMTQIQFYPNFSDFYEIVYIPVPRPDKNRTDSVLLNNGSLNTTLEFDSSAYLVEDPHSIYLRYYHMSDAFDLQLVYAWYTRQTPSFVLDGLTAGATLSGTAETEYDRSHLFGGGISTIVGNLALSQELAFNLTNDIEGTDMGVRNSDITSNTQITGTNFGGALWQLNLIYQHIVNHDAGSTFSESIDSDLREELNDYYNQPVQNIAFAIGHIEKNFMRNKLALALNAGFFFSSRLYVAPRAAFALSDRLRFETGADIWTADPKANDLMRQSDRDTFFVRLKYQY